MLRTIRRWFKTMEFDREERRTAVQFIKDGKYGFHVVEGVVEFCPQTAAPICTAQHARLREFVWAFGTPIQTTDGRVYRLTQKQLERLAS